VARRFRLPETTVRAIDIRYLERWEQRRRKPALKQMGVDEIYLGKNDKFLTVVSNLETGEPLRFARERKKETLDEFFRTESRVNCNFLQIPAESPINKELSFLRRAFKLGERNDPRSWFMSLTLKCFPLTTREVEF
jgi:hypothetical protein